MMTRRRILFVEQNRDGTIGGSHHSLLLLVQNLDRSRFDPVVAFYEHNQLVDEFKRSASVVILPAFAPSTFGRDWTIGGAAGRFMATVVQKTVNLAKARAGEIARLLTVILFIRPSLIHLNNSVNSASLEWLIAARLSHAKWITHQRGYAGAIRPALRLDAVICISKSVSDHLLADSPSLRDRTVQIYNGISVEQFVTSAREKDGALVRAELGAQPGEVLLGLVGNFQPWKGQDVLLNAAHLIRAHARWRCVLIGATPSGSINAAFRQSLDDLVRKFQLGDRITFTGYRKDVAALVNALDIMVHTSVKPEPMGRVILEGMALGKAVVATDHGGPQEIIDSGRSGLLVPPGDSVALAQCLADLIDNPERRAEIGRHARLRVETDFSTREYARRVQAVYAGLWRDSAAVVAAANS